MVQKFHIPDFIRGDEKQNSSGMSPEKITELESKFEEGFQIEDKDLSKWVGIKTFLREIGLMIGTEAEYSAFLLEAKKLGKTVSLDALKMYLGTLLDHPNWSGSYAEMTKEMTKKGHSEPEADYGKNVSELVNVMARDISDNEIEALAKIDLARSHGIEAIDLLNLSLEEYESEYRRNFQEHLTRDQFLKWLWEAGKLGEMDLVDELHTYIVNQYSVYGENPNKAETNIRETLEILGQMQYKQRPGFMKNLNDSEGAYATGSKKQVDPRSLN